MSSNTFFRNSLNWKILSTLSIALVIMAVMVLPAQAKDKVYRLKIQSAFPRGDVSVPLLDVFAKSAEERSNGRLKIKWYAAPEIVPSEQLLDSVKMGVLDMMHMVGAYWAGTMPVGDVEFGLPMSYNMPWLTGYTAKAQGLRDLYFKEGLIEVMREAYAKEGHYYLGMFTPGPVVVLSTHPVKTIEDWQGKKVRADGMNMMYYETAGAKATTIPGTDTYLSLKLGAIDMAEWDISAMTGLNWHEVAPYWVTGMESYLTMGITINLKKWNKLPEDLKEALRGAEQDYYNATLKMYANEFQTVQKLIDEKKVIVSELAPPAKTFFKGQSEKFMDDQAAKDEDCANAVAVIKQWISKNTDGK